MYGEYMKKELEKWLENNSPRVELTEVEKNLKREDFRKNSYCVYIETVNSVSIYRVEKIDQKKYEHWPFMYKELNNSYLVQFFNYWDSLGFCPVGYGFDEINSLNNHYGSGFWSVR